ncbi:hypothetical protein KTE19_12100 [Lentilactobacillus sp. IMAU92037]|uniref:hypothetical protein n=1 Tax=Lentilactobacillus TaxID=2767893 RepID=UPI001C25B286|nr:MULTISPECIES: hypothetical protein [Lentilactobacillus]MBU9789829.1 hypothetical protein [Lentilactobacillus dabitei]MBV0931425.1 hypothetical protein [Lentilactobacillus dabitei]MDM7516498.1 hypothetical protein [Lentilactobacillus sp. TOM.63]
MSETNDWLKNQLGQLKEGESSFINRSVLTAAKALVNEQDKRIRQAQDEIDERIWSPDKW